MDQVSIILISGCTSIYVSNRLPNLSWKENTLTNSDPSEPLKISFEIIGWKKGVVLFGFFFSLTISGHFEIFPDQICEKSQLEVPCPFFNFSFYLSLFLKVENIYHHYVQFLKDQKQNISTINNIFLYNKKFMIWSHIYKHILMQFIFVFSSLFYW